MFCVLKNCLIISTKCAARTGLSLNGSINSKFHSKSIKECYRQTFERLDLNRDGFITEDDLKWTITTLGYGDGIVALMGFENKEHLANTMMIALDKNKKGAVNLDSLVKFITEKCPDEERIIHKFKDLDKNEDGFVSKDDLRKSLIEQHGSIPDLVLDELVEKQMRLYDKDKDGYITMNEYISAWYYLDVVGALLMKVESVTV